MRRRGRISLLILLFERRDGCFWWIFALHLRDHCAIYTEKKCVPKHVYKKQRKRERGGWWRLRENMQTRATSLGGIGGCMNYDPATYIIVPSFWRGWKLIRRVQSEAKKRVDEKRKKKKRKISRRSCLLNSAIQLDHFFFLFLFVQVEERRDYRQRGRKGGRLFRHFAFSEWCCSSRGIKVAMTGCLNAGLELLISWMIMGEVSRLCTVCLVYRLLLQDGN